MATTRYLQVIDDLVEMFGKNARTELPARIDARLNAAKNQMCAPNGVVIPWAWRTKYVRLYGQSEQIAIDSLFDAGSYPADFGVWRMRARLGAPGTGPEDDLLALRVCDLDAYWQISDSTGTTVTDGTDNNNDLTTTGSPTFAAVGDHYGLVFTAIASGGAATKYAKGALTGVATTTASRSFMVAYKPTAIRPGLEEGLLWTGADSGGVPGMALSIVWTATSRAPQLRCYVGSLTNYLYYTLPVLTAGKTYLFAVTFNSAGTADARWTFSVNGAPLAAATSHSGTIPTVNQTIDYAVVGALRNNTSYTNQAYGTISQVAITGDVLTNDDIATFMENWQYEAESSAPVDYVDKTNILVDVDYNREADYTLVPTKYSHFSDGGTNTLECFPGLFPGRNLCVDLWYAARLADIAGNNARDTVTSTADDAFVWPESFDPLITNLTALDLAMWWRDRERRYDALSAATRLGKSLVALEGIADVEFAFEADFIRKLFAMAQMDTAGAQG